MVCIVIFGTDEGAHIFYLIMIILNDRALFRGDFGAGGFTKCLIFCFF